MNKIAILGPEYSFSHILAMEAFPGKDFLFCDKIKDVFRSIVNKEAAQGIVPLENMLNGIVRDSIMALREYKIKINKSYSFPIHHCIAAQNEYFKKVASHPQALAQCAKHLEGKETVGHTSTSKAMKLAAKDETFAAIGSIEAAKHYGLKIIQENIEDNQENVTRFILISNEESELEGKLSTSLMLNPKEDRPGLLYDLLKPFAKRGINLSHIESLPSRKKLGEYIFYIEIEGSVREQKVKDAIDLIMESAEIYSFGSYHVVDIK